MLNLADRPLSEFRGAVETGRHHWLAWANGTAVGYIDCDTYDRWTTWEGTVYYALFQADRDTPANRQTGKPA